MSLKPSEYKILQPFQAWVQQTLPAIYDDSLSYTDLLSKFLYYVNTLAENNTTLSNDVTNAINYINNYLGSDEFTEQVRQKLDEMANDGTLSRLIQPLFDKYKKTIDNTVATQNTSISNIQSQQNTLKQRMDTFTQLPGGSTSGDAELQDIRVGANGVTYKTAGEAVRGQYSELNDDITKLNFVFNKRINNYQSRKILDRNGNVTDIDADYITSDFINCQLFKNIFIKHLYYGNPESYQICFYNINKTFISGYRVPNKGVNENIDINIPTEAIYFRFSCESTKWEIYLKNFNLNIDSTLELNIPANAKKIGDLMSETYRTFKDTCLTIKNKYIDKNGNISDIAKPDTYHISEYINCTTFRKLLIKEAYLGAGNLLVAFYDRNKEYINGITSAGGLQANVEVTVPNTAYYMVLSSKVDDANYTTYLTEIGVSSNIYNLVSILENKKVVFLGDSITAGQGSSTYVEWSENKDGTTYRYRGNGPNYPKAGPEYVVGEHLLTIGTYNWYESLSAHGWAQKLKGYLMDKFNCTVHNRGCAGIYSKELRDNFERWSADSDIAFIMIGTNDRSNASIETYSSNLEYILKTLLSQSKIPVLLTSIPSSVENEKKQEQKYHMEDVAIVINRLSNKYNLTHYSFFNDIQRYCDEKGITLNSILSDDLHPNDNGYNVMFRLLCYGLNIPLKIENATW